MTDIGFKVLSEPLPNVFLIATPQFEDQRGMFTKGYHADFFNSLPAPFQPKEQFTSLSAKGVLRGMHFQTGKSAQQKLVSCLTGRILDVIVDVRRESPNYNKPIAFELGEMAPISILIGKGYAHGFLSLADSSIVNYLTSTVHSPPNDRGILWSSINFKWPVMNPSLSSRDEAHPSIGIEQCTFS
jgi:dTDP-4-dehydrorhamnose 3,5-epimerase